MSWRWALGECKGKIGDYEVHSSRPLSRLFPFFFPVKIFPDSLFFFLLACSLC